MTVEIEYKFLVDPKKWEAMQKPEPVKIIQGFLKRGPDCTIRIRVKGNKGFLTIKGKTEGISRTEFEYEIPVEDAMDILNTFTDRCIEKLRYEIPFNGKTCEVDVFEGNLNGLILAELEVTSRDERFVRPDWVTEDVSTNPAYYNAVLIERC